MQNGDCGGGGARGLSPRTESRQDPEPPAPRRLRFGPAECWKAWVERRNGTLENVRNRSLLQSETPITWLKREKNSHFANPHGTHPPLASPQSHREALAWLYTKNGWFMIFKWHFLALNCRKATPEPRLWRYSPISRTPCPRGQGQVDAIAPRSARDSRKAAPNALIVPLAHFWI